MIGRLELGELLGARVEREPEVRHLPGLLVVADLPVGPGEEAPDAASVVRYRTRRGDMHTLDDLKKVPGLDLAALERRKARIAFTGQ